MKIVYRKSDKRILAIGNSPWPNSSTFGDHIIAEAPKNFIVDYSITDILISTLDPTTGKVKVIDSLKQEKEENQKIAQIIEAKKSELAKELAIKDNLLNANGSIKYK